MFNKVEHKIYRCTAIRCILIDKMSSCPATAGYNIIETSKRIQTQSLITKIYAVFIIPYYNIFTSPANKTKTKSVLRAVTSSVPNSAPYAWCILIHILSS